MQELWLLRFARRLILIDIHIKFREDILNGFHVIERTRFFVTDKVHANGFPQGDNLHVMPKPIFCER